MTDPTPRFAVPPGQRYSCRLCGWCCRGWKIDVTPTERDRLLTHDWAAESSRLDGVQLFWEHTFPGEPRPAIQTAQMLGRCAFLEEDDLCLIHKVLGEDAKPAACRRFPLVAGFVNCEPLIALDYACSAVARNEGEPVEAMSGAADLWLAEAARGLHHEPEPRPLLDQTLQLSWKGYLALEARLLDIVTRLESPLTKRLTAGAAAISSITGRGGALDDALPPMVGLAPIIADIETPHSPVTGRGSGSIGLSLVIAAQSGSIYLSTLGHTVDLGAVARVALDIDSREFDDYLTRFVSSYILGKSLLKSATIRDGWAYMTTGVALIAWYAAAEAAVNGRSAASTEDVATGIQVIGKAFVP